MQRWLARSPPLKAPISRAPRWARRLGNLAFALAWLWATGWLLIDDFARCGIWLYEPVPVSLFRALGFGPAGDRRGESFYIRLVLLPCCFVNRELLLLIYIYDVSHSQVAIFDFCLETEK